MVKCYISLVLGFTLALMALIMQLWGNSLSYVIGFCSVFFIATGLFKAFKSVSRREDLEEEEEEAAAEETEEAEEEEEYAKGFDRNRFRNKVVEEFLENYRP